MVQPSSPKNTNESPFGFRMNCRLLASRHAVVCETTPWYLCCFVINRKQNKINNQWTPAQDFFGVALPSFTFNYIAIND